MGRTAVRAAEAASSMSMNMCSIQHRTVRCGGSYLAAPLLACVACLMGKAAIPTSDYPSEGVRREWLATEAEKLRSVGVST